MNARILDDAIDAVMTAHARTFKTIDVETIMQGVIARLPEPLRNDVDRPTLRRRIMTRGCAYHAMRW